MAKIRRGVSLEQTQDDLNRTMNVQDTRSDAPGLKDLADATLVMVDDDSGEVYFRLGGRLWKLAATEVT